MRMLWATVLLVAAQVGLIVAECNTVHPVRPMLAVQIVGFALSAVVLALLRCLRVSRRAMSMTLLGGCALMQAAALLGPPTTSDDFQRYVWDAKVQLAGIDPYRYAPSDPALAHLRDEQLFPGNEPVCTHYPFPGGCTQINRPTVHTVYPPVAEATFDLTRLFSLGGRGYHLPLQVAAALGVMATTVLLIRLSALRDAPPWPIAAWALSPVVAIEATSNAHIEWLVALCCVASLLATRTGRKATGGLFIGAAIATKLYPGFFIVTMGRKPLRAIAAAACFVVLVYLPHVIAVGPRVLGYLPQYLKDESYSSGSRYVLVSHVVGAHLATYVAPLVLAGGLVWLWWKGTASQVEVTAVSAAGLYLVVTSPFYAWYSLILIAVVAASGRLEWLWIAFAPTLVYLTKDIHLSGTAAVDIGYGIGTVLIIATTMIRRSRRRSLSTSASHGEGSATAENPMSPTDASRQRMRSPAASRVHASHARSRQ